MLFLADRAQKRAGGPGDRFQIEPLAFHSRIRAGFTEIARRRSSRFVRIEGDRPEEEVAVAYAAAVDARKARNGRFPFVLLRLPVRR